MFISSVFKTLILMKSKNIILPFLPVLLVVFCSFIKSDIKASPEYTESTIINFKPNSFAYGNKSFDEVRFVRRKVIVKVFTDVITKYKQDIPDDPEEIASINLHSKINQLFNKYNL